MSSVDEPIDGSGSGPLSLTEEPSSSQVSTDVLLVSVQQTPPPRQKAFATKPLLSRKAPTTKPPPRGKWTRSVLTAFANLLSYHMKLCEIPLQVLSQFSLSLIHG